MSERLYYLDADTTDFTAEIVATTHVDGRPAVVLNRTYFYPTSGGQPNDTGSINATAVVDVFIREADSAIVHVLAEELAPGPAACRIDRARRFDHMQHHTGQHILSQAFIRVADAHTVGFHLSDSTVTIDLDRAELDGHDINAAEALTNQIIWENRPVTVRILPFEEAQALALRKLPPTHNGELRLVDIADFDLTACGGTHVARTGSVGLLKIVKTEKRGDKLRVFFTCGGRALADYGGKNAVVGDLTALLTTGQDDLNTAVAKLQEDNKTTRRALKQAQTELLAYAADDLLQHAAVVGEVALITRVLELPDPGQLRALANRLVADGGNARRIALLALGGDRTHLLFCRTENAPGDMAGLLREALAMLESSAGGGRPSFAQGSAPAADAARIQQTLDASAARLLEQIATIG